MLPTLGLASILLGNLLSCLNVLKLRLPVGRQCPPPNHLFLEVVCAGVHPFQSRLHTPGQPYPSVPHHPSSMLSIHKSSGYPYPWVSRRRSRTPCPCRTNEHTATVRPVPRKTTTHLELNSGGGDRLPLCTYHLPQSEGDLPPLCGTGGRLPSRGPHPLGFLTG